MIETIANLINHNPQFTLFLVGIFAILLAFTLLFIPWGMLKPSKVLHEIKLRIISWWVIFILVSFLFLIPSVLANVIVTLLTFISLREIMSKLEITTRYRWTTLVIYLIIPVQFYLAKYGSILSFFTFIPVLAFFAIAMLNTLLDKYEHYLEFNGKVFWAAMLVIFGFSHVTFLRNTDQIQLQNIPGGIDLFILILVSLTQLNDVLQFLWGKTLGRHKLSPKISPNKTWEGFLGAAFTMSLITYLISDYMPFSNPLESALFGLLLSITGLFGDLNMSAVKRDLGVKDMDDLIPGHGGLLDRLDSLSFTLPLTVQYLLYRGFL